MPTTYLAPGAASWSRTAASLQEQRFVDREVGLHVTFEGGPVSGAPYRVAHLEWVVWLAKRPADGHVIARPGPPGLPLRGVDAEDVLGCYVFDPQEEVMRWRDASTLNRVEIRP